MVMVRKAPFKGIYIKSEELLARLERLLRQEGISFSEWVARQIEDYVRKHEPGNPQLPLTAFTQPQVSAHQSRWYCGSCGKPLEDEAEWNLHKDVCPMQGGIRI